MSSALKVEGNALVDKNVGMHLIGAEASENTPYPIYNYNDQTTNGHVYERSRTVAYIMSRTLFRRPCHDSVLDQSKSKGVINN